MSNMTRSQRVKEIGKKADCKEDFSKQELKVYLTDQLKKAEASLKDLMENQPQNAQTKKSIAKLNEIILNFKDAVKRYR